MRLNEVDLNGNEELTFRFRNISKMLKYKELENLEMYFCPFDMEDDVLEGSLNSELFMKVTLNWRKP